MIYQKERKSTMKPDELFFMITPPKAIADYVAGLKSYVKDAVGHRIEEDFSKAHISLFKYRDPHAEDLLYRVDSRISSFTPFHVFLKDLNVVNDGTHWTIYLEIVHKAPIFELAENIAGENINFIPSIVIARNLELDDFLKVWGNLKDLSYSQYFRCDHITVLKRTPRKWKHHLDIRLAA
jgi:2'-5' RNA ligase